MAVNPASLFSSLFQNIFGAISSNRANAAAAEQASIQAGVTQKKIEAEKEIALQTLAFQKELADIEGASILRQTLSEGLETLASQLGVTQPIVLETAPKPPFNPTPLIIGGLVIAGVLFLNVNA